MQTEWREDYSHCEAKYSPVGMEWIDLQSGRHPLHGRPDKLATLYRYGKATASMVCQSCTGAGELL
jgi:hypothetical protein